MKKLIVTSLLAGASFTAFSQTSLNNYGCGSVATDDQLNEITEFLQSAKGLSKTTATVDTLPITIQIVGKSDASGYYSLEKLFDLIDQTNKKYDPVGIYFNIKWPIKYINNSAFYEHDNSGGNTMMTKNNVANTINIYFVGDPNGNCGYYSYGPDAIAIKNSCADLNSSTLAHELGHYFTLPHTFSGWENGNTPPNPELVNGSNCSAAGDRFCDTKADYLAARWNCPYSGSKLDDNGEAYQPDGTLYMSYSDDACMNRFSAQQIAKMQNNVDTKRSTMMVGNKPAANIKMTKPSIIYPINVMYSNNKVITWNKVPGAEYYYVKIIYNSVFTKKAILTADNFLALDFEMINNGKYNVTITPVNGVNTSNVAAINFDYVYTTSTTSISSTEIIGSASMNITPNPANNMVKISLDALPTGQYNMSIINISGQKVYDQDINYVGGAASTTLSVDNYPNGLYMVRFTGNNAQLVQKMIVQH